MFIEGEDDERVEKTGVANVNDPTVVARATVALEALAA